MLPKASEFEPWLRALPGFADARVGEITLAEGGASNITCRVELSGGLPPVCLRIQRDRGIFEPYDVVREGEVLRRLAASPVPVPAMIASEGDPAVLGAPFIVTEWIDAPHMGIAPDGNFGEFTRAVAAIHAVDWEALGLGFLGVPAGTCAATRGELDSISARMRTFGCAEEPLLGEALIQLRKHAPDDGDIGLCHGDINIFNYLFRGGRVVAVVDWEQARIGDRRSDIGQLLALSHLKGAPFGPASSMPFLLGYEAAAGMKLPHMGYFRALWLLQLAVIYRGWVAFNDSEPWWTWEQVCGLLGQALAERDWPGR